MRRLTRLLFPAVLTCALLGPGAGAGDAAPSGAASFGAPAPPGPRTPGVGTGSTGGAPLLGGGIAPTGGPHQIPSAPDRHDRGRWLRGVTITEYWPAPESWFVGRLVSAPGLPGLHRIDWLYSAGGLSMQGDGVGLDGRTYHIQSLGDGGGSPATSFYRSIAVDPQVIPLGSRVYVPAYRADGHGGWFIAADTGGAINGHHIDVYRPPPASSSDPGQSFAGSAHLRDQAAPLLDFPTMPKQQRMMRVEQRGQLAAMQQLEHRSDEELEAETKFKSAAQAILGARAAERYDAKAARAHFQRAIAAARPQERLQLRRMADASLALAERRAGDLRKATERLGVESPTSRQLLGLRFMGLVAPPSSAGGLARARGILVVIVLILAILLIAFGIVNLVALPFGGVSLDLGIFYGIVLVFIAIGVLVYFGRKKQKRAQADRAEQLATRR